MPNTMMLMREDLQQCCGNGTRRLFSFGIAFYFLNIDWTEWNNLEIERLKPFKHPLCLLKSMSLVQLYL